jgi:hypothetical protein
VPRQSGRAPRSRPPESDLDQRRLYEEIAEQWISIADELERRIRDKPLAD